MAVHSHACITVTLRPGSCALHYWLSKVNSIIFGGLFGQSKKYLLLHLPIHFTQYWWVSTTYMIWSDQYSDLVELIDFIMWNMLMMMNTYNITFYKLCQKSLPHCVVQDEGSKERGKKESSLLDILYTFGLDLGSSWIVFGWTTWLVVCTKVVCMACMYISHRQKYFKQKLQLRSAYHMILHQNESTKKIFSHFGSLNATI